MTWNFLIIGAIVIIFIILLRRIPVAREMYKQKKIEVSRSDMNKIGLISQADDAFERRQFEEAERIYVQVAAIEPNNAKVFSRLGAIYLEQKNYYDSKEAFLQAIKVDPENPSKKINLGLAYMGLKDYYKAQQAFSEALKLDPKNDKYKKLAEKAEKLYEKEKRKK